MMDYAVIERITAWLLTYAVHSTLLIGLAFLVAGRKSRLPLAVRDTIWKTALVGGLATASLQHLVGIRPWASLASTPVSQTVATTTLPDVEFTTPNTVETAPAELSGPTSVPVTAQPMQTNARVSGPGIPTVDWLQVLLTIWVIGMVAGLARLVYARVGLQRILSKRSDVTELQLLSALTEMRHRARIFRPLHLTQSDKLPGGRCAAQ